MAVWDGKRVLSEICGSKSYFNQLIQVFCMWVKR